MLSIEFMKGQLNAFRCSQGTNYTTKPHEFLQTEKSQGFFCLSCRVLFCFFFLKWGLEFRNTVFQSARICYYRRKQSFYYLVKLKHMDSQNIILSCSLTMDFYCLFKHLWNNFIVNLKAEHTEQIQMGLFPLFQFH